MTHLHDRDIVNKGENMKKKNPKDFKLCPYCYHLNRKNNAVSDNCKFCGENISGQIDIPFVTLAELAKAKNRSKHSIWQHAKKKRMGTMMGYGSQLLLNKFEASEIAELIDSKRGQYDRVSKANKK